MNTFESADIAGLSFAIACTHASLLIAPSMLVRDASGLYSERPFVKGELRCHGSSMCTAWVPVEAKPNEPANTLHAELRHTLFRDET